MEYSKAQIRTYAILGPRGSFGVSLLDVAKSDDKIVALAADLCNTSGMDRFAKEFPDRFINVGIAEQNLVGIAAGYADEGYTPFTATFANFATLRANEFVRHFMSYMNSNIKLVGIGAGFEMEYFGNTHYAFHDVAAIQAMPGICIVSPADGLEVAKAVQALSELKGPAYLRLSGKMGRPSVYKEDYDFEIGKAVSLSKGDDVTIIATGSMVSEGQAAAVLLLEHGVSCGVINMHTLSPFDHEVIKEQLAGPTKAIVTVEEHSVAGGLGSMVAASMMQNGGITGSLPKLITLGVPKSFIHAGDYDYMLSKCGLKADSIVESVLKALVDN